MRIDDTKSPRTTGVRPYLAGQYATYITFTLQEWQRGYRKNNPDQMAVVAKKLSAQEIAAVAAYYQQSGSPLKVAEAQPNAQTKE
jgi:cytochrome c553